MPVYDLNGNQLYNIYDKDGNDLDYGYDKDGNIVFQKHSEDVLTSYEMFYPNDASGEYEVADGWDTTLTATEFLELKYDDYVTNPPTGVTVTKTALGKDSTGQYDIYEYDFRPTNAKRKVLLVSGEHAYETTASFGLAHLIKHIYRIHDNDAFDYIRHYVEIKVIPIMNPWGFNQSPKSYGVYGGINPERNFNYNGLWEMFTGSNTWNKKGDYPFQTAETRLYAKWCMDNQDADFRINCHTSESDGSYDLWIDYMTQTASSSAILEALAKNEEEFKTKFNKSTCRSNIVGTVYPNQTGYGMHGAWDMFCVRMTGFTMEQAPHNTIFGNGKSNSAGAINNYASVTATYIMEMLLDKYQHIYDSLHPNDSIPITGISGQNVSMGADDYSKTVALTMTPSNTTQFTFDWVSSDASICEVWGCTEQAVIVKRGTGTATITVTNRNNSSVSTSFTVTVTNS